MLAAFLFLLPPLAHFPPKTYASIFSFPLSQSSRLILATPRVPGRFMSQRKTERQLHHLSGKVTRLRKISHREGSLQTPNDELAVVTSQLSKKRPATGLPPPVLRHAEVPMRDTEWQDVTQTHSLWATSRFNSSVTIEVKNHLFPFPDLWADAKTQNASVYILFDTC